MLYKLAKRYISKIPLFGSENSHINGFEEFIKHVE